MMRSLLLLLAFHGVVSAAEPATSNVPNAESSLRPEHQGLMIDWGKKYRTSLRSLETQNQDKETLVAVALIRRLIDLPRLPFDQNEPLVGSWRVRSLQVSNLGAYLYPFFSCKISDLKKGNTTLQFRKPTGSQRKNGILQMVDEDHYLFTGAYYFDDEEPRHYSGQLNNPTEEDLMRDSIGHLYKIGKNHYLMAFSPQEGAFEIYEIKK
jgi:hypothetical protein